jgi:capsule biosynthesis phosphatase
MKYVFDIDGTICETVESNYSESVPNQKRIKKINDLYEQGHTIIFHTARGMGRNHNIALIAEQQFYELTEEQLNTWGVKYHELYLGKPSGDVYIDDKGIKDEYFFAD